MVGDNAICRVSCSHWAAWRDLYEKSAPGISLAGLLNSFSTSFYTRNSTSSVLRSRIGVFDSELNDYCSRTVDVIKEWIPACLAS